MLDTRDDFDYSEHAPMRIVLHDQRRPDLQEMMTARVTDALAAIERKQSDNEGN